MAGIKMKTKGGDKGVKKIAKKIGQFFRGDNKNHDTRPRRKQAKKAAKVIKKAGKKEGTPTLTYGVHKKDVMGKDGKVKHKAGTSFSRLAPVKPNTTPKYKLPKLRGGENNKNRRRRQKAAKNAV